MDSHDFPELLKDMQPLGCYDVIPLGAVGCQGIPTSSNGYHTHMGDKPMSRTYNFGQSQKLLQVDPKTFARWLKKAKIDPSKQINLADPRKKFLTEEQILMLAKDHGREVHFPPLDQEEKAEQKASLAPLQDRLAALEQEMIRRFDQVTELLASLDQRITQGNQVKAVQRPAPTSPTVKTSVSPARAQPKKPVKKTKAKELPRGFIPLSVFKSEHGISNKAVEYAMEKQKLAVKRGKWLHNDRNVMIALDAQGRQQFYELFHERQGFQRCEQCPHAAGAK